MNEADTCREFVRPKLEAAGWDESPHAYKEQEPFTDGQRFPEEPKHLQDKDLRVHYFAKKSLSWYAPNIRP